MKKKSKLSNSLHSKLQNHNHVGLLCFLNQHLGTPKDHQISMNYTYVNLTDQRHIHQQFEACHLKQLTLQRRVSIKVLPLSKQEVHSNFDLVHVLSDKQSLILLAAIKIT